MPATRPAMTFFSNRRTLSAIMVICFAVHFIAIVRLAVNIPLWDEWGVIEQFQRGMTWQYIFAFFNEHRIVVSKAMFWLQYHIDGLNLRHAIEFNLLLYFAAMWMLVSRYMHHPLARIMFILLAFSGLTIENLGWAIQSQFHLFILFIFGSHQCSLAPSKSQIFWLAPVLAACGIYSFSAGVISAACLVVIWIAKGLHSPSHKRDYFLIASISSATIASWFIGFHFISWVPKQYTALDPEFYEFLFNLISFGFGYRSYNILPGIIILTVFLFRVRKYFKQERFSLDTSCKFADSQFPFLVGVACVFVITKGRVDFGIGATKISRYAEIAMLLVPGTFDTLFTELTSYLDRVRCRRAAHNLLIASLAIGCFLPIARISLVGNLFGGKSIHTQYRDRFFVFEQGETCIREAFRDQKTSIYCETVSPSNLKSVLDWAKDNHFSFAESL